VTSNMITYLVVVRDLEHDELARAEGVPALRREREWMEQREWIEKERIQWRERGRRVWMERDIMDGESENGWREIEWMERI
jgi:hypothetical protein